MNFLARIMSHGFAIALVVLLGIGYIYRGELFPELELPEFLQSRSEPATAPIAEKQVATAPAAEVPATAAEAPVAIPPVTSTAEAPAATAVDESPLAAATAATGTLDDVPAEEIAVPATQHEPAAGSTESGTAAPVGGEPTIAEPTADAAPAVEAAASEAPDTIPTTAVVEQQAPAAAEPTETGTVALPETEPSPVPGPAAVEMEPPAPVTAGVPSGDAADTGMPATAAAESEPLAGAVPQDNEPAPVESWPSAADSVPPPVVEQVASDPTAAAETVIPAPGSTGDANKSPYQLLAAAREAYWLNDYEQAEINYRKLTELEPDNPDGFGELGNMFFSQGKWDAAATAYFEAGSRLVKGGNIQEAKDLLNVIRGLDGAQADELERLISQATAVQTQ